MKITLLHDTYDDQHLEQVINDIQILGTPEIKVYPIDKDAAWYQAIEGSHRLRACEQLGITPKIIILDADTPFINDDGCQIIDWDGCLIETIGELGDTENYTIEF